jgi:alpha-beta hydrolase superfamily lysophospholipase
MRAVAGFGEAASMRIPNSLPQLAVSQSLKPSKPSAAANDVSAEPARRKVMSFPTEFTPPAVSHESFTVRGKDDVSLMVNVWRPETGQPKGVVMIAHGLLSHSDTYDDVARELVQRGYVVYAHDHRGHGASEGKEAHVEAFDDYVEDMQTVFKRAREEYPDTPVVPIGHSMGGQIALRFAMREQKNLAGVGLISAALGGPTSSLEQIKAKGAKALASSSLTDELRVFKLSPDDFSRDPAVVKNMKADPRIHEKATAKLASELLMAMDDSKRRIADGQLQLPLFALHGGADTVTNPNDSVELAKTLAERGNDANSVVFNEGNVHDLLHDVGSEKPRKELYESIDRMIASAKK